MSDEVASREGSGQTILLVDDDEVFRERMARALRGRGLRAETAAGHDEALAKARNGRFKGAVLDLRMPGPSGIELLAALKALDAEMRIIVLTGYGSIATTVEAMRLGAVSYLPKPVDADDLLRALGVVEEAQTPAGERGFPALTLARAEWEHLQRVLGDCGGNKSVAARRLGITRRTLQLKLKKYPPRT